MKLIASILILLLLIPAVSQAKDNRWFRSQARVTRLEPVVGPGREVLRSTNCRQPVLAIASSMVGDIRQQEEKLKRQRACRAKTRSSHRIVGYWVTYEYNGYEGRKYMPEKPGSWIPVKVSLEPMHTARSH